MANLSPPIDTLSSDDEESIYSKSENVDAEDNDNEISQVAKKAKTKENSKKSSASYNLWLKSDQVALWLKSELLKSETNLSK